MRDGFPRDGKLPERDVRLPDGDLPGEKRIRPPPFEVGWENR